MTSGAGGCGAWDRPIDSPAGAHDEARRRRRRQTRRRTVCTVSRQGGVWMDRRPRCVLQVDARSDARGYIQPGRFAVDINMQLSPRDADEAMTPVGRRTPAQLRSTEPAAQRLARPRAEAPSGEAALGSTGLGPCVGAVGFVVCPLANRPSG